MRNRMYWAQQSNPNPNKKSSSFEEELQKMFMKNNMNNANVRITRERVSKVYQEELRRKEK
jgi:hypothetical protein